MAVFHLLEQQLSAGTSDGFISIYLTHLYWLLFDVLRKAQEEAALLEKLQRELHEAREEEKRLQLQRELEERRRKEEELR